MTNDFIYKVNALKHLVSVALPGEEVQLEMAPFIRKPLNHYLQQPTFNPQASAVGVIVYPAGNDLEIILIQRPSYNGHHSNQIAFPGGKKESVDESLYHTAVREVNEEIGIGLESLDFIGELSKLYIPVSNFMVYPFLFFCSSRPPVTPFAQEVEDVLYVSVRNELLNAGLKAMEKVRLTPDLIGEVPCYKIQNKIVWGATAMILREVEDVFQRM